MTRVSMLAILLLAPMATFGEETSIYKGKNGRPGDVQMSTGIECEKRERKLQDKIQCYRCCVGEVSEDSCGKYDNYKFAQKKKSCGCQ